MKFTTKITISGEVLTHEHNTIADLKETLRNMDTHSLYQLSNIYMEEDGRPLDGSETLVRLILS